MSKAGDLEARIVVCGRTIIPNLLVALHERFGNGNYDLQELNRSKRMLEYTADYVESYGAVTLDTIAGVELTVARDPAIVAEFVKEQPDYYSAVVYSLDQFNEKPKGKESAFKSISNVRKRDPLLPQVLLTTPEQKLLDAVFTGMPFDFDLVEKCVHAGITNFAEGQSHLVEIFKKKIFRRPVTIDNLVVFKIGGSAFDHFVHHETRYYLERACKILSRIHQDRDEKDPNTIKRLILTAGGGALNDIVKLWAHNDPLVTPNVRIEKAAPRRTANALVENLEMLRPLFDHEHPNGYGKPHILEEKGFNFLYQANCDRRIPLVATAPRYIAAKYGIPMQDSDTHTLALADYCGAQRVVLLKRTDRIYRFDPYRGFTFNHANKKCADLQRWKDEQRTNEWYESVTVDEMLGDNISREGTDNFGNADGTLGHLMEASALRFFRDHCRNVKEIVVAHIASEEMYEQIGTTEKYRHIITDEEIFVKDNNWDVYNEKIIRDAYNGISKSRIIR